MLINRPGEIVSGSADGARVGSRDEKGGAIANYQVQRSITINADPAPIYDRIANFRNWASWSPWEGKDPNMTKAYAGPESGVGSSYAWKGNRKVGEGKMTITDVAKPKRINFDLHFLKPFKSQNQTEFSLDQAGEGTEVTWTMVGEHNLFSRIMGIFVSMDRMIGKDFEKGLAQLKKEVEA